MKWTELGADLAQARLAVTQRTRLPDFEGVCARYATLLARQPTDVYNRFDPAMRTFWAELLAEHGADGLADASALAMLDGIAAHRRAPPRWPEATLADAARWQARIVGMIAEGRTETYARVGETLYKDLAVCRGAGFPAAAWMMHEARFARRFLVAGGVRGAVRALPYFLLHARARGPWLSGFLNPHETDRFNADGFRTMLRAVATRLQARADLGGLFLGGSWLYDPALPAISPRLSFHRDIAIPGGARTFFTAHEGADSWALRKSDTRRAAFAAGTYRPQAHLLIWPRAALLDWAERGGAASLPASVRAA